VSAVAYEVWVADRIGDLGPVAAFASRTDALRERDRRMAARSGFAKRRITYSVPDPNGEGEDCEWTEDEESA
jgi:hypothetical protein